MHGESATQPSPGHVILREQFRYFRLDNDPTPQNREVDQWDALTWLEVGLRHNLALSIRVPLSFRWEESDWIDGTDQAAGVSDITTMLKWRILKKDSGPLDSARLSLLGGAEIRSGDSDFSSDSYDPIVGLVYTQIRGRHGFNAGASWKFTTDGNKDPLYVGESKADLLRYDASYLFRLYPSKFEADSHGAWYAVAELTGYYETDGDHEILLSPCLMYEGRNRMLELAVQLPALQELDHRPETRYVIVAGLRFLF